MHIEKQTDTAWISLQETHKKFTQIRHDIHRHPETAFEEFKTADLIAEQLQSWGIEVHRGFATTGVVGILKAGDGDDAIGLRADMDALHLDEMNSFDHKSVHQGRMHGCGHDGHTTMLLAAAEYLAKSKNFSGTVYFIFQPAEENEGGGKVMVEEGLFDKFPVKAVFGMHNIPGIPLGSFAVRPGAMMAGYDRFDITIKAKGGHAAMPDKFIDPIVIATDLVGAINTIVSRNMNPMHSAVVSVTRIAAGETYNVIPETATLAGTVRYFNIDDQALIQQRLETLAVNIAKAYGATAKVEYRVGYPPTLNSVDETAICTDVLIDVFGADKVDKEPEPLMAGEDFAFMLQKSPGCYVWAGNGSEGPHSCMVHNPNYDFNDELIPLG
ncbi:M20 aminoacylase family protein, partial [Kordiimonas pumila]